MDFKANNFKHLSSEYIEELLKVNDIEISNNHQNRLSAINLLLKAELISDEDFKKLVTTEMLKTFTSNFYKDNLFGTYPYPIAEKLDVLRLHGIACYINLTTIGEKSRGGTELQPYNQYLLDDEIYIHYSITDKYPPKLKDLDKFDQLITNLVSFIKNDKKIYIHCRGGHGRSGLVAACVLVKLGYTSDESLVIVYQEHDKRELMSDKMRKIGCPQNKRQINFVHKYYEHIQK